MIKKLCATTAILLFFAPIDGTIIGSDVSVSRQTRAFFKRITSSSNRMKGFSVFENGFVLENAQTTAQFDAFFPIRGDIVLNGGTLELLNDLEFKNPFRIGVGSIHGNGFSLGFPNNISYLDFPSKYYIKLIVNLLDTVDVGKDVYSVSWSHDDAYVALGLKGAWGAELHVYQFTGTALSFVTQQDFGTSTINSLQWHPTSDYIAIALSSGTELQTWQFNRGTDVLSFVDSSNIGYARAVAWSPDGSYLAVGERKDSNLHLYPVTDGVLGSVWNGSLGGNKEINNNAISWKSTGDYCAIGLRRTSGGELRVVQRGQSDITQVSDAELSAHVYGVAWRPNSDLIAIGLGNRNESLRLYRFDDTAQTLTEVTSGRVGLRQQVIQAAWDKTGTYLALTKEYSAQGYEVEVYYFDAETNTLHLVSGYSSDAFKRAVAWSTSGNYLLTGDDSNNAYLFNFTNVPFTFKDLKLYFGSEVRGHADIRFEGACTINGGGNIFKFDTDTNLIIESNSTLILEDIHLKGVQGSNIRCVDDTGVICLRNTTWAQDGDYTFTHGSFHFIDDVTLKGNSRFIYSSNKTSTIAAKSSFILDSGVTFSYDPTITHTHLIELTDETSEFLLNGATIATGLSGMEFLDGTLRVERDSFMQASNSAPLYVGNLESSRDCYIDILSGVHLRITAGELHYKNALASSWNAKSYDILHLEKNTQLILHAPLNIGNGTFFFNQGSLVNRLLGGDLIGKVHAEGPFTFEYER